MRARPGWLRTVGGVAITVSLLATALMVVWWGAAGIGDAVWRALPVLPAALAVHAVQLTLSGLAWWSLLGPNRPRRAMMVTIRWVREAGNTLLPLAGLGGGVVATRLLAAAAPMPPANAAASVTADLTVEAMAQVPFLLAAIAVVGLTAPDSISPFQALLAIVPVLAACVAFVTAQRLGLMRLVERGAARLGFPRVLAGLHDALMALHREPGRVARAFGFHLLSWCLGGAEVWVVLRAIGHPVAASAAFAIEGLGMAARSAGFALPAGLAAQEAGFVLAGAAFGVSAADSVALSMVKRLRELAVCLPGVIVWRVSEVLLRR